MKRLTLRSEMPVFADNDMRPPIKLPLWTSISLPLNMVFLEVWFAVKSKYTQNFSASESWKIQWSFKSLCNVIQPLPISFS